jgi:acyl transferase domain-containing protein
MKPMEPIAVIGMAGRFPGARNLDQFWRNLRDGVESITRFSEAELLRAGVDPAVVRNPDHVPVRGVLEDAELFDAAFFAINPREAQVIDPQQRIFLECAWEALENAGYDPERYARAIGVYAGLSMNSYLLHNLLPNPEVIDTVGGYQTMLGNDKDFLTTRVSYKLNLRGPSLDIQTACSTSLVAVQVACQSLLAGQCEIALAGGVSVLIPQRVGYMYQPGMILSPDGHCRVFDAGARGTVPGEGVGIVVLKRLSEAVAAGDHIRAVIKGAAINNDGSLKVGYTAPSVDGQSEVIGMAQAMGGVEPESISYVEAHGTATELGDPIEITALTTAFRARTAARGICAIGSVKSNIGHLDAAAGVAGLIKAVLALEHGLLPPSLHFVAPNPRIDFGASPFFVNTTLQPWPSRTTPRRAGVSSFGIGGTNAHVVLEEAPAPAPSALPPSAQVLTLSARTPAALEQARARLAAHLREHSTLGLADVAFTLQCGRRAFAQRAAVVCRSLSEAVDSLDGTGGRPLLMADRPAVDRAVSFLFPGQGSQYVNMGRGLYETEPVFRAEVDACATAIAPDLGVDLRTVLYPVPEHLRDAEARLRQTSFAQPALFIIEYALATLWMHRGLRPDAMIGHSIGEYVAACMAGVLQLKDALALVVERGRLMQIPNGGMLSVSLAEERLVEALPAELSIAATNAPSLCVVSGPEAPLAALEQRLHDEGVPCQRLHTAHAFHSAMMTPALAPFAVAVGRVSLRPPAIPYLSNVTGTWITARDATDPGYWVRHLRETVRFSSGLRGLLEDPDRILLEVGPGHTLASLARQHQATGRTIVSSMRHPNDAHPDTEVLLTALGRLWMAGASVDWSSLYASGGRRRVPLPTYPFERQRYWVDAKPTEADAVRRQATRKRADLSTWFYAASWQRVPLAMRREGPAAVNPAPWLVFSDDGGLGDRLAQMLTGRGASVVIVTPGDRFEQRGERHYRIPPGSHAAHAELVRSLHKRNLTPERIVHCWSMLPRKLPLPLDAAGRRAVHERGFLSVMALMQALGDLKGPGAMQIAVVSDRLQEVAGESVVAPERASVFGPSTVIPQEYRGVACRAIDVSPMEPGSPEEAALLDELMAEFEDRSPAVSFVAYRAGHRWLRTFAPCRLEASEDPPARLRRGGTFLITGGLGGIGLVLAEYLARTVAPKLVLTGRSGLPRREEWGGWLASHGADDETTRRIRKVEALEALGAEVLVVAADVSDADQMRRCLAAAVARFGRIDGVIHSAGLGGGGIIQLRAPEASAEVLASKVEGTSILMSLLADTPPDFVLLCSSITAILGGPGMADYCGANACLDAFARSRPAGRPAPRMISVNWDAWQEVGMAVNTPVPRAARSEREQYIKNSILPSEGAEAFARILRSSLSEVVVSTRDFLLLETLSRPATDAGVEPAPAASTSAEPPTPSDGQVQARANVTTPFAAPRTPLEQTVARLWEHLLAIEQVGIHDDFFELGGHSLLATQLISRLRDGVGVEFPLREVFEARTVAAMVERIQTIQSGAGTTPNDRSSLDREEIEL